MLRLLVAIVGAGAEIARRFPLLHIEHVGPVITHVHGDAVNGAATPVDDDGCCCAEAADPDRAPPEEAWVVSPESLREWLQAVEDGQISTDDLMTHLELAELGSGGCGP